MVVNLKGRDETFIKGLLATILTHVRGRKIKVVVSADSNVAFIADICSYLGIEAIVSADKVRMDDYSVCYVLVEGAGE